MARMLTPPSYELSIVRNIHLYDDDGAILGGVFQNGSLTRRDLYDMCPVFLDFDPPSAQWCIFALDPDGSTGKQLGNNHNVLETRNYIILASDKTRILVHPNSERYPRRVITSVHSSRLTPRRAHFRDQVRRRDNACMISGQIVPEAVIGDYIGFEAAHIFPQSRLAEWTSRGFHNFITEQSDPRLISSSKIHSPQNGILLSETIHALFDDFRTSIDPDNNYRIVCFRRDAFGIDGRTLGFACRDPQNPTPVSDDLLRWHFRTSILANIRGAAVPPTWESDFPEGDMIGEIMEGGDAAERMEAELFTRLMPGEIEEIR